MRMYFLTFSCFFFKVLNRSQKNGILPGKKTYKGLTFQTMLDYIRTQTNSEDKIKAYNAVRRIAKVKGCEYPLTKKWFLKTYPDYKETDITAQEIGALLQEQEKAPILQLPMPVSSNVVGRDA